MVARTHVIPTRIGWFVVVLGLLAWTAPISGGDPKKDAVSQSTNESTFFSLPKFEKPLDAPEMDVMSKEVAFNEIKEIQQRLGGSVLQGSTLNEASQRPGNFDAHVREQLGLPPQKAAPTTKSNDTSTFNLGLPDSQRPESKIVRTVREQVMKLDSIANDIESLRAYAQADALRETAKKLRLIARELDADR